ncbi:hypothetical protein [Dyella japonica]|uniref:Uncharacterized protein n=1 Tax=Dyella japonica A8 TaxID=1217721 RepID=A0A075K440_9GAMM|nr:hypothetical protein [Dyella japonica]AIF48855.1 hypothetical protein HY57_17220 [Dyella japonica A8]
MLTMSCRGKTVADFSISKAIGSGFSLVVRRPVSVLAWSVAYLLVVVVPIALTFGYLLSEMPSLFANLRQMDPHGGMPADIFRLQSRMMMANPLMMVTGLAGRALLVGAVYRSMLEPDNRRFFSLRFGKQELWLALSLFVYGLIVMFALLAVMLGGGVLGSLAWLIGSLIADPAAATLTRVVLIGCVVMAAAGVWIWVAVRLSLGPVMTFAEKEFRLPESWALTEGHAWKLAGLGITLAVIAFVFALIIEGIVMAIAYGQLGGLDKAHLQAFFPTGQMPHVVPLLLTLSPAIALGFALVGPLFAIMVAPLASVYRDLKGRT